MEPDEITAIINGYTPGTLSADEWQRVGSDVRRWVTAACPGHPHRIRQLLAAGAQLAAWCHANGIALTPDTALRETTIERYCAIAESDGRHSTTTRATIRARLRYLASAQRLAGQPPKPPELRRGRVKPPYTAAEIARFFGLVAGEPEPHATRLTALLLAGLGAGCGSEELRHLRGTDVTTAADGVVLAHLLGRRERSVAVVGRYAARLVEVAAGSDDVILIGGQEEGRRAVASRLLQRLRRPADLPPLEPGRLRSTWIVGRLEAGVRLDVVMEAAGLTTPTTIVDLAAFLPPLPADVARAQLLTDLNGRHDFDGSTRPRSDEDLGDCPPGPAIDGPGA